MRWQDIATPEPDYELVLVFSDYLEDQDDPSCHGLRFLVAHNRWPCQEDKVVRLWLNGAERHNQWNASFASHRPAIIPCFNKRDYMWSVHVTEGPYSSNGLYHPQPFLAVLRWFCDYYVAPDGTDPRTIRLRKPEPVPTTQVPAGEREGEDIP